jgi:outer membrane receptor protein involved in Fe transport
MTMKNIFIRSRLLSWQAFLPFCCAFQVHAGVVATDTSPADSTLPTINVVSHYDTSIGDSDAASQGVIKGALLADIPILRPGEVLENVPGMVVTQHSGDGKANQYFLRGYNLDHGTDFATSIDGVPVNMPTHAHGQGYTDVNFLIPELIQRIDYRKGPYFAENGDFASAGSADIKYRDTLDQGIADLTLGSFEYRRALIAKSFQLSDDKNGPRLLTAFEGLENNGPWDSPEKMHKLNGLLRLSDGTAKNGWSIDGILYKAHWNSTDQVPLELLQSGQLGRYAALDPTDGGNSRRAIISGEWHTHDDHGYTKLSAYAQHYQLQLWSNFTFYELRPATGDQFEQHESRNFVGGQAVHGWINDLLGNESITEIGLQVRHDNIDVGLTNSKARMSFQTISDNAVDETEIGTYLQNTTTWNSWFKTLFGLREDAILLNMDARVNPENSGNKSDTKLSPKMSLIFGPWAKTEFFVNYGQGFHSNDARGVLDKVDPTTFAPADPVPALVGSIGKEIGVRTEIIPGLQSSIALWRLDSASELTYSADSGSTSANGASKRYGVEWNNHMIVNPWLLLDADLAWTHARYVDDNANGGMGHYISNAVSKVGLLRATMHKLGPWSASAEMLYIGGYPLSQDNSLKAPSAIVTNLRVGRQLTPKCAISLDALNIFNRQYYEIEYQQDYQVSANSPVVPSGITAHPSEPRQFRVSLHYNF